MESDTKHLLRVSGISIQEKGNFTLQDISFNQQESQKIAIAGETGAGKSTLLKIIAGLIQPDAGEVWCEDERVLGPAEKLVPGHPGIAYLSQHFELPKSLRVEQVLRYANTLPGNEAATLYEICRITHLLERRTDHLSGGEKQRIALAKLLISSPKLLLLDEPYSNLDAVHKNILKSVVRDVGERLGITCTLTSHDPLDTLSWADEIVVIRGGKLLQQGSPEQIYRRPVSEYVAALFGSYNLIVPEQAEEFYRSLGMEPTEKHLLIRPESFKVVTDKSQVLVGAVQAVTFYGSYYELEVRLKGGSTVTVRTTENKAGKGDTIYLSVAIDSVGYV
ncbi:ABC-type sugar transport system ATPase subunit [Pontibacter ummariensis]|uniref:ABC-type sugar transport system, ATPase component n=1 Tax=Pontibacter ummariensis TaxID=1610492 RepID=A0A239D5J7_9BACT|nr:ABC transporter ATP-binding protein [Pontibacter ummariensis]PRY14252.1 ABC-type sugar transport system ATPase subunit [Pontibacter ummariensis]SNS27422.1 ABC-type sugar transport system, ATPase component [Pontibacter ummariensis]